VIGNTGFLFTVFKEGGEISLILRGVKISGREPEKTKPV
jgi:hypothetical protein